MADALTAAARRAPAGLLRRWDESDARIRRVVHALLAGTDSAHFQRGLAAATVDALALRRAVSIAVRDDRVAVAGRAGTLGIATTEDLVLDPADRRLLRLREAALCGPATPLVAALLPSSPGAVVVAARAEGRLVALVVADRGARGGPLDDDDRREAALLSRVLGDRLERQVLRERLERQRDRFQTALACARSIFDGDEPPDDAASAGSTTGLDLTRREWEILGQVALGATNATVAERFVISEETVKSHVKSILRKLGARNRAEAAGWYARAAGRAQPSSFSSSS